MATPGQLALIRALWAEYTGGRAGEAELAKWIGAKWHVTHLRFLRKDAAQKAITALKAMKARVQAA